MRYRRIATFVLGPHLTDLGYAPNQLSPGVLTTTYSCAIDMLIQIKQFPHRSVPYQRKIAVPLQKQKSIKQYVAVFKQ